MYSLRDVYSISYMQCCKNIQKDTQQTIIRYLIHKVGLD